MIATVLFFLGWCNSVEDNNIDSSCIWGLVTKRLAGGLHMGGEEREELKITNKFLAWAADKRWCYLLKADRGRVNRFVGCGTTSSVWDFLILRSLWVIPLEKSSRMLSCWVWSHLTKSASVDILVRIHMTWTQSKWLPWKVMVE